MADGPFYRCVYPENLFSIVDPAFIGPLRVVVDGGNGMAVVVLCFMIHRYTNSKANVVVLAANASGIGAMTIDAATSHLLSGEMSRVRIFS